MSRILIAEDEPGIASFLRKGFTAAGFTCTVVEDGFEALYRAADVDFDLLILDLGLPRLHGHEVLARLRARGERLPVIILTARSTSMETVAGLEGGADDYVTKPFRFQELLARVRARLRDQGTAERPILQAGSIRLDLLEHRLFVGEDLVELSAREFTVLELFLRHPDRVLSREDILSHAWGYDSDTASNVVEVCIGGLRRKLGHEVIDTVRGRGYRLVAPMGSGSFASTMEG